MSELLKGAPAAAALRERTIQEVQKLNEAGVEPLLAILRVGEDLSAIAYEKGAMKQCEKAGVAIRNVVLPEDVPYDVFYETLEDLNHDEKVHGILLLRPLPQYLDNEKARQSIAPAKDVDGCTDGSLAGVFTDSQIGFPPCTARSCMEILHHYGVELKGRRAVVLGRSLVIGRPVAMLLMHEGATPTICHSKTADFPSIAKEADILVAACGKPEIVTAECLRDGQVILDVGMTWDEEKQGFVGDVDHGAAAMLDVRITPVTGGVGTVTCSVLAAHVVEAAKRSLA